jgi:hypothetical protein
MMNNAKQLEAQLHKHYWDDGVLDLLCGVGLLLIGVGWFFGEPVLAAVGPAILVSFWVPLRRSIVEPHAGYVEFSNQRQQKTRKGLQMTIWLGVGALLVGLCVFAFVETSGSSTRLLQLIPALPAVLLAFGALLAVQITGARRFLSYALVLIAASIVTVLASQGPAFPMLVGGTVVSVAGAVLLIRFRRESARFEAKS